MVSRFIRKSMLYTVYQCFFLFFLFLIPLIQCFNRFYCLQNRTIAACSFVNISLMNNPDFCPRHFNWSLVYLQLIPSPSCRNTLSFIFKSSVRFRAAASIEIDNVLVNSITKKQLHFRSLNITSFSNSYDIYYVHTILFWIILTIVELSTFLESSFMKTKVD